MMAVPAAVMASGWSKGCSGANYSSDVISKGIGVVVALAVATVVLVHATVLVTVAASATMMVAAAVTAV